MTKHHKSLKNIIHVLLLSLTGLIIWLIPPYDWSVIIVALVLIIINFYLCLSIITGDKKIKLNVTAILLIILVLKVNGLLDIITLLLLIMLAISIQLYFSKKIKNFPAGDSAKKTKN